MHSFLVSNAATAQHIEPGKLANMVVLARDPLSTIDNLNSIVMTIKRGRIFPRSDFVPLQGGDIIDF